MGIERTVRLLDKDAVASTLGGKALPEGVKCVAYETDNRVTNRGEQAWTPETGLPSIWMLGMYNPSPKTTVVIPFKAGDESELGPKVNDTYFGKVPPEYLTVHEGVLFFKGDGTHRGKIGITAQRSKGIAGSYDADGGVLNIVTYIVVTGGGSGAMARCLRRPGASKNVLEVVIPYSHQSLVDYLGHAPSEGNASMSTALEMADTALLRACRWTEYGEEHAVGIALTAALPTHPPRRGSDRIHVAMKTNANMYSWTRELERGQHSRESGETIADDMFREALAELLRTA